jgi:hypothetical protein
LDDFVFVEASAFNKDIGGPHRFNKEVKTLIFRRHGELKTGYEKSWPFDEILEILKLMEMVGWMKVLGVNGADIYIMWLLGNRNGRELSQRFACFLF